MVRGAWGGVLRDICFTSPVFGGRGGVERLPWFLGTQKEFHHPVDGWIEFSGLSGDFTAGRLRGDEFLSGEYVGQSHEQTEKARLHNSI